MLRVTDIADFLEAFAPSELAESWDNVGLLVGDRDLRVERVMTCLTITPASAAEAIAERADLIVSHHPLPFRPLNRVTSETTEGRLLWQLIGARISIFSPHTAFDSARQGINQRWANLLHLSDVEPLAPRGEIGQGAGRYGRLPSAMSLAELAARVKQVLALDNLQAVGPGDKCVQRVAVACGSAGEYLAAAQSAHCDCFITGEARFHACLAAEAMGIGLILTGHFASERFAVEALAEVLAQQFPDLQVWASQRESDPVRWL